MKEQETYIKEQGKKAFLEGVDLADCPHADPDCRGLWVDGWILEAEKVQNDHGRFCR